MANKFELKTNEYLKQCDSKDIVSFGSDRWADIKRIKYIVNRCFSEYGLDMLSDYITSNSEFENSYTWFDQGQNCEILRAGSPGWQKGKLKINVILEFIPDEPEIETSPLDDIRQGEINNQ